MHSMINTEFDFRNSTWGDSPSSCVKSEFLPVLSENLHADGINKNIEFVSSNDFYTVIYYFTPDYKLWRGIITIPNTGSSKLGHKRYPFSGNYDFDKMKKTIQYLTGKYNADPIIYEEWGGYGNPTDPEYINAIKGVYANNKELAIQLKKLSVYYIWNNKNTVIRLSPQEFVIRITFQPTNSEWMHID